MSILVCGQYMTFIDVYMLLCDLMAVVVTTLHVLVRCFIMPELLLMWGSNSTMM